VPGTTGAHELPPGFYRRASAFIGGFLVCFSALSTAQAQTYPARPVRLIVSFAPGGSVDLVARLLGQKLGEGWGQQVVVDNRPGAGGNVSAEIAAQAAPDGYTLYISSASLVVNPSLYRKVTYDPLGDFAPVTLLATVQNVLVANPAFPAKTVRDLIALARKSPGKILYASTGGGSSGHLAMELLKNMAGIDLVHVPYKVIGQATTDLMSGQVSLWFPSLPGALPHITGQRMQALAVTGARRSPALPDAPTVAESGVPGYEATTWYPVLAPRGTPQAIVDQLNARIVAILKAPDFYERLMSQGVEPVGSTPAELSKHMRSETVKWARVVKAAGVSVD
jgi:tripartite-type tricarboxylate transporter receptor subunit TctC